MKAIKKTSLTNFKLIQTSFREMRQRIEYTNNITQYALRMNYEATLLRQQLSDLISALQFLVSGHISPLLITKDMFQNLLNSIQQTMDRQHINFQIVYTNILIGITDE